MRFCILALAVLWIGFVAGFYFGRFRTILIVKDFTCSNIEDRQDYEMCRETVEENLKRGEP
jgi:hypothetical protein